MAQRISKNLSDEIEIKNSLVDNMFSLVLLKIEEIKKLHLLDYSKRKSYEFTDDFVKIKKIIDQY